jgi:Protein of unknown function (DUF3604)
MGHLTSRQRQRKISLHISLIAALGIGSHQAAASDKRILFGDTHVHTTYSADAFAGTLPMKHGASGAFPPADACDYARYISQIDFYFLTDHAESYLPEYWQDAIDSVQRCSQQGDGINGDLVAFIGWEWSQVGITPETHYGHHNVLFKDIDRDKIPARPIGARGVPTLSLRKSANMLPWGLEFLDIANFSGYRKYREFGKALAEVPECESGVASPALPAECLELAGDPQELFQKLDEWGFETLVVPHGSAWGMYTPPGASWSHQLQKKYHDPDKMRLVEVYSGHGNSENYRKFRARPLDAEGNPYCPQPSENYLPSCWQAGEIIRERCLSEGESSTECDQRAYVARQDYVDVPHIGGWKSIAGTEVSDWLDAGQARDVYMPAFNLRPMKSVQYGLAIRNFDDPGQTLGYRWGLIGSTDTHSARAGHGFKEYLRINSTEAGNRAGRSQWWNDFMFKDEEPVAHSRSIVNQDLQSLGFGLTETERRSSFLSLGGLVAVHAEDKSRDSIWAAMQRKEVYGTTGVRINLWFDLINTGTDSIPMGGEVTMQTAPQFRVKALGSFKQLPGCPEQVKQELDNKSLQRLGQGECFNPSDERRKITHIEVVRIRPQQHANENVDSLIEDRWKTLPCSDDGEGCVVTFSDNEFTKSGRDTLYYVRAIEEMSDRVNGHNLRTTYDKEGKAVSIDPCYGDSRTPKQNNCLSPAGHRAWSSPIFVDYQEGVAQ